MSLGKIVKYAMIETNITQLELAGRVNQTQGNLSRKLCADNLKYTDFKQLIEAMGCKVELKVVLPDGRCLAEASAPAEAPSREEQLKAALKSLREKKVKVLAAKAERSRK